jgi:protein SCO1/2
MLVPRFCTLIFVVHACLAAPQRYAASGLVLAVDLANREVMVSHGPIAGYMDAMSMPFHVLKPKLLEALHPGENIAFTLVVDKKSSWIEDVRVVQFDSAERDPAQASRLKLLSSILDKKAAAVLATGDSVPDFTLTDQTGRSVTLSQFAGRVIAMNFVYTRCPLPDYCFRLSNHFAQLQKRFANRHDLELLTVSFDPENDQPEVLARYARIWKSDPERWHFLTGPVGDVQRVCGMFGAGSWPDEGLLTHSLHTVVIDRSRRLVANIEGNRYTARQLGDLVDVVIRR